MAIDTTTKRKRHRDVQNNPLVAYYWKGQIPAGNTGPFHIFEPPVGCRIVDVILATKVVGVHGAAALTANLGVASKTNAAPGVTTRMVSGLDAEALALARPTAGDRTFKIAQDDVIYINLSAVPDTTQPTLAAVIFMVRDDLNP